MRLKHFRLMLLDTSENEELFHSNIAYGVISQALKDLRYLYKNHKRVSFSPCYTFTYMEIKNFFKRINMMNLFENAENFFKEMYGELSGEVSDDN